VSQVSLSFLRPPGPAPAVNSRLLLRNLSHAAQKMSAKENFLVAALIFAVTFFFFF
jgi:hypothetical protein